MKKQISFILMIVVLGAFAGCQKDTDKNNTAIDQTVSSTESSTEAAKEPETFISTTGTTIETRIMTPPNYKRIDQPDNSLTEFFRKQALKEDGSPVLLYDGQEKGNQSAQIAVLKMDVGEEDLQQCADSIMRLYAEYYWSIGDYDSIAFHLVGGFMMDYDHWREGMRLAIDGNNISWTQKASYDDSYDTFRSYLRMVFAYASTLSFEEETEQVEIDDLKVGDMFIKGGSPGHCVLVLDIAEDENGNRCFLLGQGYMPAQEFHVLKNPKNEDDPWYYLEDFSYPLRTPEYTFQEGSLKRWGEF